MCDCTLLIESITKGGTSLERTLLEITKGTDPCGFKKLAFHVYRNYCGRCKHFFTWEDLYFEMMMRFISAIEKGTEPRQKDCRPLLFQIAKHVCWEWGRKQKEQPVGEIEQSTKKTGTKPQATPNFPIEDLVVLMKMVPELREATDNCLDNLGRKGKLILGWRYFQDDPEIDPQTLSLLLTEEGFKVSAKVIPQEIANCKAKLRACLIERLESYYTDFFY